MTGGGEVEWNDPRVKIERLKGVDMGGEDLNDPRVKIERLKGDEGLTIWKDGI